VTSCRRFTFSEALAFLLILLLRLLSSRRIGRSLAVDLPAIVRPTRERKREREGLDVSLGTSGVYARGEVSSSNKRKVALRILLLLLHTGHRLPPSPLLGHRSSSSSPRFFLFYCGFLCASFPRNRAYFSLGSCKQSDSKLPAIVAHGATMTTDPGEALNTAEVEDAAEDRLPGGEARSTRSVSRESENGSVNALDRIPELRR